MPNDERPAQNTDRELWHEPHPDPPGDYYANSIHVTAQGSGGIGGGGTVIVRTPAQWHALEAQLAETIKRGDAGIHRLEDRLLEVSNERDQAREECDRLRDALKEISEARQKWQQNVGWNAGGETNAGFSQRLQKLAKASLAPPSKEAK